MKLSFNKVAATLLSILLMGGLTIVIFVGVLQKILLFTPKEKCRWREKCKNWTWWLKEIGKINRLVQTGSDGKLLFSECLQEKVWRKVRNRWGWWLKFWKIILVLLKMDLTTVLVPSIFGNVSKQLFYRASLVDRYFSNSSELFALPLPLPCSILGSC